MCKLLDVFVVFFSQFEFFCCSVDVVMLCSYDLWQNITKQ